MTGEQLLALKPLSGIDRYRVWPMTIGGETWTAATDGHFALVLRGEHGSIGAPAPLETVLKPFDAIEPVTTSWPALKAFLKRRHPDPTECATCHGKGGPKCKECYGDGVVDCYACHHETECEACDGDGYNACPECGDSPKSPEPECVRVFDVHIDRRVADPVVEHLGGESCSVRAQIEPSWQVLRIDGDHWILVIMAYKSDTKESYP
jgi:hypothetical protein